MTLLSQIVQVSHYGIAEISQIERTYKKMNEYLMEIKGYPNGETFSDEEIIIEVSNRKLHTNRKKKSQKEKYIYGKESNYNLYC